MTLRTSVGALIGAVGLSLLAGPPAPASSVPPTPSTPSTPSIPSTAVPSAAAPVAVAVVPPPLGEAPSSPRPAPTAARAPRPPAVLRLALTTANVRGAPSHEMAQPRVQADLDLAARRGGALLLQEIWPVRYKRAVRRTFADRHVGLVRRSSNPVVVDRRWRVLERGRVTTTRTVPGTTPPRSLTWLVLAGDTASGPVRFVLMNTHFVAGAWNGRRDADVPLRQRLWDRHYRLMRRYVTDFNARGLTVVGGGDFNRRRSDGLLPFTDRQRWLFDDVGVDKLFVAPAPRGARVRVVARATTQANSDHDFRTAWLRIAPAERSR
ncbi:hypothetical protein GCM10023340_24690 [Nocardioides marinquilinus]|uniref:Endonuclease/exonuclease/phosphatase domain-containing protein n=1 Tax=Nocardioides marinquilinus TaxID=1210400 RepID=A0ABP9PNN7_9ACTN